MDKKRYNQWSAFFIVNPRIWDLFVKYAREARQTNRDRFSARVIAERIRWYCTVETVSKDGFKLNDHHTPYYARLLMLAFPAEFKGFFKTKWSKFDATEAELVEVYKNALKQWGRETE